MDDWMSIPADKMTLEQARNAVKVLRERYLYDMAIPEFQTESLISRYQNDTMSSVFVTSPTEVIKVGEPLSNFDEIRQAFENGEIYKRGFEDARKRYERPQGEWIEEIIEELESRKDYGTEYAQAMEDVIVILKAKFGMDMEAENDIR